MLVKGLIIKVNSDTFTIKTDNDIFDTKARGKFRHDQIKPLVGDYCLVDKDKKIVEKIENRRNFLMRPSVANIDIALIVTSIKKPDINLTLLDKLISIITINKIEPVIILTKMDLLDESEKKDILKIAKYYDSIGLKVFENTEIIKIKKYLKNKIVTVCGQTGAGKSTLINKINPELNLKTDEISLALGRGKHTTRIVELFPLDDFYIVDTPGFSSIDINIYSEDDIKNSFIEFKNSNCRFKDCKHINEQDCEIKEKVNNKEILITRYENYLRFIKESKS